MQFEEAKDITEAHGIQMIFNEHLKLYQVIYDDQFTYVHPDDLKRLDTDAFRNFLTRTILEYVTSRPVARLH
jgi:hypothetical protein